MYQNIPELEEVPCIVEINDKPEQMGMEIRHTEDHGYVYPVDGKVDGKHFKCWKCGKEWIVDTESK